LKASLYIAERDSEKRKILQDIIGDGIFRAYATLLEKRVVVGDDAGRVIFLKVVPPEE
jgi:hypothetical protein